MAIYNLFSKRQKKLRAKFPDIYQYEEIPQKFRVQVIHIMDAIENTPLFHRFNNVEDFYFNAHKKLCEEYGEFTLMPDVNSHKQAIFNFFVSQKDYEKVLDVIEVIFQNIQVLLNEFNLNDKEKSSSQQSETINDLSDFEKQSLKNMKAIDNYLQEERNQTQVYINKAIEDLNQRFKESGIGYAFQNGELIRIDSQFIHSEAVKPVLVLLANEKYYEGVNQEFLKAHEHYRHKRYKECLVECCKAFESLMKAICEKRKWNYNQNDTASKLIKTCFDNKLIPSYMDNQIASLKQILGSGVSTIRNKEGGHGQGAEISEVSEYLASYCLHLTASNLLFLANCEKQLG